MIYECMRRIADRMATNCTNRVHECAEIEQNIGDGAKLKSGDSRRGRRRRLMTRYRIGDRDRMRGYI